MKKFIVVTVITACLILCAAVWPQGVSTKEATAAPTPTPTVTVTRAEALGAPKIEELIIPEEKTAEIPLSEIACDIVSEPEPAPDQLPTIPEIQVIAEPEPEPADAPKASAIQPTPKPQSTPAPTPPQTDIDPQPGDMVYVPGFGWLECQGPGEVIHDTEIHENGNKIGNMG